VAIRAGAALLRCAPNHGLRGEDAGPTRPAEQVGFSVGINIDTHIVIPAGKPESSCQGWQSRGHQYLKARCLSTAAVSRVGAAPSPRKMDVSVEVCAGGGAPTGWLPKRDPGIRRRSYGVGRAAVFAERNSVLSLTGI
jgi:hypothetical protein